MTGIWSCGRGRGRGQMENRHGAERGGREGREGEGELGAEGKPELAQRVRCARREVASKYINSQHLIRPSYFHVLGQWEACEGVIFPFLVAQWRT